MVKLVLYVQLVLVMDFCMKQDKQELLAWILVQLIYGLACQMFVMLVTNHVNNVLVPQKMIVLYVNLE
jgi:uncharacterized membrane protein YczE